MNKPKWLLWLNPVLFISMLIEVITGLMLFFDMFVSRLKLILSVHTYNGLLLIGIVMAHIWLNWSWVRANLLKRVSK